MAAEVYVTKTVVMHLGNTNQKYTYHMDEQPLQVVSEYKDLGVIIEILLSRISCY